jgi:hypothetical protein
MKQINITIHPFSALIGAAIVCITMLTVGAVTVQGSSSTRDVSAMENVNDPHPRDYVRIDEGTAYTVPTGKILVITGGNSLSGLGSDDGRILFNGVPIVGFMLSGSNFAVGCPGVTFSKGLAAPSGTVVSLSHGNYGPIVCWGYLVDA